MILPPEIGTAFEQRRAECARRLEHALAARQNLQAQLKDLRMAECAPGVIAAAQWEHWRAAKRNQLIAAIQEQTDKVDARRRELLLYTRRVKAVERLVADKAAQTALATRRSMANALAQGRSVNSPDGRDS